MMARLVARSALPHAAVSRTRGVAPAVGSSAAVLLPLPRRPASWHAKILGSLASLGAVAADKNTVSSSATGAAASGSTPASSSSGAASVSAAFPVPGSARRDPSAAHLAGSEVATAVHGLDSEKQKEVSTVAERGIASSMKHSGDAYASLARRLEADRAVLDVGVAVRPHPEKEGKGGEDAFFASLWPHDADGGAHGALAAVGVADGVGGWALSGIDPRQYAVTLMRGTLAAYESETVHGSELDASCGKDFIPPVRLMETGVRVAHGLPGSCTACVAVLHRGPRPDSFRLMVSNIGDSGLRVYRKGNENNWDLVFGTAEQQHYFNCPFQLPSDSTADADNLETEVMRGDIVLLVTDGISDNLFQFEIGLAIAAAHHENHNVTSQLIARRIAGEARLVSMDPDAGTPFASHSHGRFEGGKVDDIACVVLRVLEDEHSSASLGDGSLPKAAL